jgi:hypothetical protein
MCERCCGRQDVFALKLIYDIPIYLCRACLEEAALKASEADVVWGFGER